MAFGIDASSHRTPASGWPQSWSHTAAADASHLLVFTGTGAGTLNDRTVDTCTYNSVALTADVTQDDGNWARAALFIKSAPVADGANNIEINSDGACNQIVAVGVSMLDATVVSTGGTVLTNQTNPGITGISTQAGDIVIGAIFTDDAAYTITADGTLLFEDEDIATDTDFSVQYVTASGTSTNLTWTQGSAGGGGAAIVYAVLRAATTPQVARPAVDVTDGAWSPSTGADNYAVIDETPASDTDYTSTTSNSTGRVGLSSLSTPGAGTQTLRARARGSPAKKLLVRLIESTSTVRATITVDPLTAAFTDYSATASGISNYADLDVEFETAAATSPPTLQVTFGAAGTSASGTTSCAPSYPTGISAATSKLYCVATGRSNTANTAPTMPAGWTSIGSLEGGTGTWGVDTGTRRVEVFVKDTVTGSESGTVTVSLAGTTANTLRATIIRVEVPSGYGIEHTVVTGADTTNGTGYSATGGTQSYAVGDLLMIATAQNIDTGTATSRAISASGITFSAITNRADTAVTNGNDHRHIINEASVTAGSGTVAPTFSYTISASGSGPTAFLRLRAVEPTEAGAVSFIEFEVPAAGGPSPGEISESAAATDTVSATIQIGSAATESTAATDTPSATQATARDLTESAAATDTPAGASTRPATVPAEGAAATDTPSATSNPGGSVAESAATSDTPSAQSAAVGSISEPAGATDTPSATAIDAVSVPTESAAATDAVDGSKIQLANAAESAAATESQNRVATYGAAATESAAATDTPSATGVMGRAVTESAAATDVPSATQVTARGLTESAAGTDTSDAVKINLGSVVESLAATEVESAQVAAVAAMSESVAATDAPQGTSLRPAGVTESSAATESVNGGRQSTGSVSETISATEAVQVVSAAIAAVIEASAAADGAAAIAFVGSAVVEAITSDSIQNAIEAGAIIEESVAATDFVAWLRAGAPSEPRVLVISVENRTLTISSESRTLTVPLEARTLSIAADDRNVNVQE